MIIREWRGRASSSNVEAYAEHFRNKVVPELCNVSGFVGAHLGQRQLDDRVVEFLVITRWRSMDAIRAFAGVDLVTHYEIIEEVLYPKPNEVIEETGQYVDRPRFAEVNNTG
jgi:heme-degrading monooxygenase HmoA